MDSQRFDELTRGLATARSRRDVVKSLIGGLFAGGAVVAAQRSGALAQGACAVDTDCGEGQICCTEVCQTAECCLEDPDPNARCPEGTSCFEGTCDPIGEPIVCTADTDCGEGEICCAEACRPIQCCIDDPDPNARCPEGTTCNEGQCVPVETPCSDDTGCADGEICCANVCRPIQCCIDEADPNARCPEGTTCNEGQCVPVETPCSDDTGCADGEICCANVCRAIECCIDEADPNARCPEGTSCFEGICTPVGDDTDDGVDDGTDDETDDGTDDGTDDSTDDVGVVALPETGAGTGAAGKPPVMSALLAGGAAVAAAFSAMSWRKRADGTEQSDQ
jgi:hypothetical protein